MERSVRFLSEGYPGVPGRDTAIARALLVRASEGLLGETFRLHVPGRIVAFGKHDMLEEAFPAAVAAAGDEGFLPVLRLAGGRAAVFHERTLAFHWTVPDAEPRASVTLRYESMAALMVAAFARLGIATEVGELAGEYCPGRYSVHLAGGGKVMGVGQRLARGAAHVGGVVVVSDPGLVNRPLVPVYRHLGVAWDPDATGALDEALPGLTLGAVSDAIVAELPTLGAVAPGEIDEGTLELADRLVGDHVLVPGAATGGW
ncbi:MAG TPA: lipoate--protein ligase family protein [Acidimicrobiia bacterium]|jgi:lipoate-protein ligase A